MHTIKKVAKIWLVIGWFLVCGSVVGFVGHATLPSTPHETVAFAWFITELLIGSIIAVASVGMIRKRKWARQLLELGCWFLLLAFLGFGVFLVAVELPSNRTATETIFEAFIIGGISVLFGGASIYTIVLLRLVTNHANNIE